MKKTKKTTPSNIHVEGSVNGIGNVVGNASVSNITFIKEDPHSIRAFWHSILREHGQYSCYAVFLLLPSDNEAISYFREFGRELNLISGKECLVLAFGETELKGPNFDNDIWSIVAGEHVAQDMSIKIAQKFKIKFTQFPCLLVFRDIRSPEHVIINLKNHTSENIAENLRKVFSIINTAVSKKQDPVHALNLERKAEYFQKTGLSIVSEVQSFAGKTLDTVMEAFIKASIH